MARRSGRRKGPSDTRDRIAAAARAMFAEHGYDRTSVRAVAARAAVDPALVHHYFGTKQELFIEAVALPLDSFRALADLVPGDPDTLGEQLVRFALDLWDDPATQPRMLGILRSAVTDPGAARMLAGLFTREGPIRLVRSLGVSDPDLRAELVGTQLVGLAMARYVLRVEPLATADRVALVRAIGPTIQRYLTGELESGAG